MLIKVTQEQIDSGIPETCDSCPIALAARESGLKGALVHPGAMIANGRRYALPFTAQAFIQKFDSGLAVKPFSFELDIPV